METSEVMGIKFYNSTKKINAPKAKITLKLADCVVKDVKFYGTNCSHRYEALYFNELR